MKETMLDYIQKTPEMIRKNVQNNKELTRTLVEEYLKEDFDSIVLIACGSSYNSCMSARPFMEKILKKNVKVLAPYTYENYENQFFGNPFVVVVSQSGCSTNSIRALQKLKEDGHRAIGITSNVNSDFGDGICDVVIDYGIGIETVGYVTMGMVGLTLFFMLFSLNAAKLEEDVYSYYIKELNKVADAHECMQKKAVDFYQKNRKYLLSMNNCYMVGMGPNFGTALEGALKFGETIQIVSVAYELEEFLHGHNFQITPNYTLFFIDNSDACSDHIVDIYNAYATVSDRCFIITDSKRVNTDKVLSMNIDIDASVSTLYNVVLFEYIAYQVTTDLNKWQYHPLTKDIEEAIKIKSEKYKEGSDD